MSIALRSCVRCARHIRITESTCPFCAAAVPADRKAAPAPGRSATRMQRAFALSAVAAAAGTLGAASDCGGKTDEPPTITAADAYGAIAFEAGTPVTTADAYGGVAFEAEAPDGDEPDVPTVGTAYGGVQFPESGVEPDGEGPDEGVENDGGEGAGD